MSATQKSEFARMVAACKTLAVEMPAPVYVVEILQDDGSFLEEEEDRRSVDKEAAADYYMELRQNDLNAIVWLEYEDGARIDETAAIAAIIRARYDASDMDTPDWVEGADEHNAWRANEAAIDREHERTERAMIHV